MLLGHNPSYFGGLLLMCNITSLPTTTNWLPTKGFTPPNIMRPQGTFQLLKTLGKTLSHSKRFQWKPLHTMLLIGSAVLAVAALAMYYFGGKVYNDLKVFTPAFDELNNLTTQAHNVEESLNIRDLISTNAIEQDFLQLNRDFNRLKTKDQLKAQLTNVCNQANSEVNRRKLDDYQEAYTALQQKVTSNRSLLEKKKNSRTLTLTEMKKQERENTGDLSRKNSLKERSDFNEPISLLDVPEPPPIQDIQENPLLPREKDRP